MPRRLIMNWYLLNLPLAAAIATAVVAPIMVVICRESGDEVSAPVTPAEAARLGLVPARAPRATTPTSRSARELQLVS
jgi:hypothetical protein